jgi:ribosome maturation factor RimP
LSTVPPEDRLDTLKEMAGRVARSHGLELFDLQHRRESIGWVLRVVVDRPEGGGGPSASGEPVTVDDCQRVSQDLGAMLDVEDPFEHRYTLEVSSPGLDRPLRHLADYRRFAGRLAKVVVSEAVDGQMHLAGRLKGVDDDVVLIEGGRGRLHRVPMAIIRRGRLDVEF